MDDDGYDHEAAVAMAEQEDACDNEAEAAMAELERRGAPRLAPEPAPRPQTLPREGACVDCGKEALQAKFHAAFGLHVCFDCSRKFKAKGGKYQLMSKTTVKDEFLLTDKQLSAAQGGLGCMAVPNPNNPKHGDMKLYLRSQAEAIALRTWQSEEALLLEKERRRDERLRRADTKRKAKELKEAGDATGVSASKKGRAGPPAEELQAALARLAPPLHEHSWSREEYDDATDLWTRYCECGFSETYEQM